MAQQNFDARHGTNISVGRDQINLYHTSRLSSSSQLLPALISFNDAPDLLSCHFTGRKKELNYIKSVLSTVHGNAPNRCVVHGIPGIGKTQLALQYAELSYYRQQYSFIFWISGATVEKLNQGLAKVLTIVDHPDRDHPEQSTRLASVRHWFEQSNAWLLVLDNVALDAVAFLRENLPRKNSSGNILMTTRTAIVAEAAASVAGQQHQIFELRAPDLKDATNHLLREAGINADDAVAASTNGAEALVNCVGRLPLAISHVASFAKQSHVNLDDILHIYQSKHKFELISWENKLSRYEQKSVAITFSIQLEELERQSTDFGNFLKVLSFFDTESIPIKMITEGVDDLQLQIASDSSTPPLKPKRWRSLFPKIKSQWGWRGKHHAGHNYSPVIITTSTWIMTPKLESLINLISSPVHLQQAIQKLHCLSLVGYESTTASSAPNAITAVLRIHDLVQFMIQESMRREDMHDQWFNFAARLVCGAFRHVDDPTSQMCWAQCEMLSPHMQSLTRCDDEHAVKNYEFNEVSIGISQYLWSRGRYSEAETLSRRALAGTEILLGPQHLGTLRAVHQLAIVYDSQGRYKEAETLYGRVLKGRQKLLGSKHMDTLGTVHNLASTYQSQGRYSQAEMLYRRALAGSEKLLGHQHPNTLHTVHNLAIVYQLQGRCHKAETLFKRALAGREKVIGPDHLDTLGTLNNLANDYRLQGRYVEAETLLRRALAGREKVLGSEHPDTLQTIGNLAIIYKSQGRYGEAEKLYRRSLAGFEKVLGIEHPDTLRTVRNLTNFLMDQCRYEEATIVIDRFPLAFQSQ
ncbi:hypothetical protein PILCRDRAFT_1920 [Piloderma croceum F 1598]|uniref:NB-ARC domain-containing protein n=1 Tax=Piloderma croceum (strain F 1598) TaxID=765440 RepID=A0A0C3FZ38_PILCF|nr:hypothetical protein PILCRDRAFT_1920 [Piloderma croceum F 1598]